MLRKGNCEHGTGPKGLFPTRPKRKPEAESSDGSAIPTRPNARMPEILYFFGRVPSLISGARKVEWLSTFRALTSGARNELNFKI